MNTTLTHNHANANVSNKSAFLGYFLTQLTANANVYLNNASKDSYSIQECVTAFVTFRSKDVRRINFGTL